jgi:hypothetical protein
VTFVITIVGAALGPLPFGWFAAQSYFPVLVLGAMLCVLAAAANLIVGPQRPTGKEVLWS